MTAPAAAAKETRTKTAYVVLKQVEGSADWKLITTVRAANATAAIKSYAMRDGAPPVAGGTYVAIPARSWKPVTVKTETTTHLMIT